MSPRFQFSLRTLLLVVLVSAALLAWFAQRRDAAAAQAAISQGGMVGSDGHQVVTEVVFAGQRGDVDLGTTIRDADLASLRAFPYLQKLDLTGPNHRRSGALDQQAEEVAQPSSRGHKTSRKTDQATRLV